MQLSGVGSLGKHCFPTEKNPEAETRNVNDMESSFMRNTRILSCGVIFK